MRDTFVIFCDFADDWAAKANKEVSEDSFLVGILVCKGRWSEMKLRGFRCL